MAEKFAPSRTPSSDGVPVLDDALAWLACDVHELLPGGDHTIGIGAVTARSAPTRAAAGRCCTTAGALRRPALRDLSGPAAQTVISTRSARNAITTRGEGDDPDLARDDRVDDRVLLGLRQRGRRPARPSSPRWSSTVCAAAIRSCSAMIDTAIGSSR